MGGGAGDQGCKGRPKAGTVRNGKLYRIAGVSLPVSLAPATCGIDRDGIPRTPPPLDPDLERLRGCGRGYRLRTAPRRGCVRWGKLGAVPVRRFRTPPRAHQL